MNHSDGGMCGWIDGGMWMWTAIVVLAVVLIVVVVNYRAKK